MNGTYCNNVPELSPFDQMGVSVVYPGEMTLSPLPRARMVLGDGTMLVYPGTEAARRLLDSTVHPDVYGSTSSWYLVDDTVAFAVVRDSAATDETLVVPTALGDHRVNGEPFDDFAGRIYSIASGSFTVERDLFSSLVATVL